MASNIVIIFSLVFISSFQVTAGKQSAGIVTNSENIITSGYFAWFKGTFDIHEQNIAVWLWFYNETQIVRLTINNMNISFCEVSNSTYKSRISCSDPLKITEKKYELNVTISSLSIADNGINVRLTNSSNENVYGPKALLVEDCKTFVVNNEGQTLTVTANQTLYTYDQKGICSCTGVNGTLNFNNGTKHSGVARCNETAQWDGCENAQCWFAPQNVTVSQKNNITNKPADLVCSYDDGFPAEFQEIYYIEEMEVLSSEILQSDLHMKSYKCAVGNNYTDLSENKAESETETLIVYFAPEKLLPSSLRIGIAENETEEVFFTFRANSPDNVTTTFSKINGSKLEHIHEDITSQGYYNITYSITINSHNDYGKYVFIANTSVPPGSATQTITITEYDNTTNPTDTQNNIVIIASTCAALLVVIIALVILLVFYRKRRKEKLSETSTNKEEKDNPLYGITTRDNSAGEPSSTKEERANPLYDTNSGTPDKVEEAYAAVDVRKKKKNKANKGTENSAFSPESNAAVYAAVDKSKKKKNDAPPVEAVYSEVNKKKGPNTAGLHGSSK